MFSLKKRRLQGILTVAFHYKKGGKRLIREHSDMTRSGSFKLSRGRVRLDIRNSLLEGDEVVQRGCGLSTTLLL